MRVLWTHNFPPHIVSSGIFMRLMLRDVRAAGVDVSLMYTGNLRSIRGMVRAATRIRALSRRFDLVHSQYGSGCGWVTSFADCPKMMTLRGTDLFGAEQGSLSRRLHGILAQRLTGVSQRAYDQIVVVSQQMRSMLEAGGCRVPIHVIPSGLDLTHFRPMDRLEARRRLGYPNNSRPWILVAATFATNSIKRWPLAKAACDLLKQTNPDVELHTVSGVEHSQMPLWVNACDLVLVTSSHEGWPNIVKESLACNVPFVSTDVSDLKQIAAVEPSCRIAAADPQQLADAMQQSLGHSRTAADLRRHVEEMHLPLITQKYLSAYARVCERPLPELAVARAA